MAEVDISKIPLEDSPRLPGGYDENFMNPVDDDLQCSICFLPLREPVLTRCGHRFCKECLEQHMTRFVIVLFTL